MTAVVGHGCLDLGRRGRQHGTDAGASLEEGRRLALDDLQVARLGGIGVVAVQQLQHLALGDAAGGMGKDVHDPHGAHIHHHFEGARIEEIPHQNTGGVAPDGISRVAMPALIRAVHHVIVKQGRGMDELDDGRQIDVTLTPIAAGTRAQEHTQRRRRLPPLLTM